MPDPSFDDAAAPWAPPTPLASILANALRASPFPLWANPLTPWANPLTLSRRDVANTLGAPVDGVSYLLHKVAGLNIPTTTPSSSTPTPLTPWANYQPAANVPGSSEFFNNLLGDAGALSAGSSQYLNDHPSINALARTLRRRF